MNSLEKPKIIVILGPTASGKTNLSIKIAEAFNGEIISADSRQVYKGLNIGSGKVTKEEMDNIPHYLLDVASPKKVFSVAEYQELGEKAIKEILAKNKLPIICGGTGLYINSLVYNLNFPEVPPDKALREKLDKKSTEELFKELENLDPERALNIDSKNKRRLIRALEIIIQTGKPVPKISQSSPYEILKIGINWPKEELAKRIKKRLLERLQTGMIEEAENLHKNGLSFKRMEDLGLEYRYLSRYLQKEINYEKMVEELNKEINQYAKRQMTWFKKEKDINWLSGLENPNLKASKLVSDFLNQKPK